ncbi:MAG: hypothetical protein JWM96_635 [Alphaproteobacteria bacterium]|nr:hypothetical protein [Alphaproteobacteria bacterium]
MAGRMSCSFEVTPKIRRTIDSTLNDDTIMGHIEEQEKNFQWPYLDSEQRVTVGIGKMLPDIEAAKKLPFKYESSLGKRPATENEIQEGFNALTKLGNSRNLAAEHYKSETKLRLNPNDARQLAKEYLQENNRNLRNRISDFDTLPGEVKLGLYDMNYLLGNNGLSPSKWPKLYEAINNKDWAAAAKESQREGIGTERNERIRHLFLAPLKQK